MPDSNRRLHGRARPPNVVSYVSIGKQRVTAAIDNISSGGAFLRTSSVVPVGTVLGLEFFEPGQRRTLTINARVVSSIDPNAAAKQTSLAGMGVEFEDLSIDHHRRLRAMIEGFESNPTQIPVQAAKTVLGRASAPAAKDQAPGIKRRRNRRVPSRNITAHVRMKDEVIALEVPVNNLSMGGLFLELTDALPIGSPIDVELRILGESLIVSGVVVGILTAKVAAERRTVPGMSMRFGMMARRTGEKLRAAMMAMAPLAADGLKLEEPPEGYFPEAPAPAVRAPTPATAKAPMRGEFDFDVGDLSAVAALETEDLYTELTRLKHEIAVRAERVAEIEQSIKETGES